MMQKTASFINSFGFSKVLCLGVGISRLWFDKIKGEEVVGVDAYDKNLFPRLWTQPTKGIPKTTKKSGFDAVIINDSKHYKDLEKLFKTAKTKLKEGGKIIFTDSVPSNINLVTTDYLKHQNWCGDVFEFVLSLKAKGGYQIESFEIDNGVTIVEINDKVKPEEITLEPFEDWYFNRKTLMNIK